MIDDFRDLVVRNAGDDGREEAKGEVESRA